MNEREFAEVKKFLKQALPTARDAELSRDLWPVMLKQLDQRSIHVPWWDWALLACVIALSLFFPGTIPALLYHL